ncbi:uncharacterized protein GJ701_014362 [Geothlypis trichas]
MTEWVIILETIQLLFRSEIFVVTDFLQSISVHYFFSKAHTLSVGPLTPALPRGLLGTSPPWPWPCPLIPGTSSGAGSTPGCFWNIPGSAQFWSTPGSAQLWNIPGSAQLCSGTFQGSAQLWNIPGICSALEHPRICSALEHSRICSALGQSRDLFSSGTFQGSVQFWNIPEICSALEHSRICSALEHCRDLFSSGTLQGSVQPWDTPGSVQPWDIPGICSALEHPRISSAPGHPRICSCSAQLCHVLAPALALDERHRGGRDTPEGTPLPLPPPPPPLAHPSCASLLFPGSQTPAEGGSTAGPGPGQHPQRKVWILSQQD